MSTPAANAVKGYLEKMVANMSPEDQIHVRKATEELESVIASHPPGTGIMALALIGAAQQADAAPQQKPPPMEDESWGGQKPKGPANRSSDYVGPSGWVRAK